MLQGTIASVPGKGKSILEEPACLLEGNARHSRSQTTETYASTEETAPARLMTDRELLINLHQNVGRNHNWAKRQIADILQYLAKMQTTNKKSHFYAHDTYERVHAILTASFPPEEIPNLGITRPIASDIQPPHKFKPCQVPEIATDTFSAGHEETP